MNEMQKTGIFAGVALVLALGAGLVVYSQSLPEADPVRATVGMPFFPDFTDPLAARALEIVSWDKDKGQARVFQVAQVNGLWSLPSKDNYPADAERQLAEAASNLINRKKERLVDSDPKHHGDYGVLDPQPEDGSTPAAGDDPEAIGVRVVVRDGGNNVLAQFIVGKEDKDDSSRRYVRVPGQDIVYTTEIRIDRLSTRFEDWIEKDLLKLNPFDLAEVTIVDYSVDIEQGLRDMRSRISLIHDAAKSEWKLDELLAYQEGEAFPVAMQPEEELATDTLNALKTALDELRIVDVQRQPPLAGGQQQQIAALQALGERGFYPVQMQGGIGVISNEGEIIVALKDGVEYMLRFGEIAIGTEQSAAEVAAAETGVAAPAASNTNRYLHVSVAFNEEAIPKPELKPLPGDPVPPAAEEAAGESPVEEGAAPAETAEEATPADPTTEPTEDAAEPAAAGAATDEEPAAPEGDDAGGSEGGGGQDPAAGATDEAAADTAEPAADAAQPPAASEPAADGQPAAAADQPAGLTPEQQAERLRIQAENESALEAYEKKIKDGQERVEQLQLRFQDWFFVISNSTYEKIHLGRGQIIREKTVPPGDGDTLDDFDALREQGPQGAAPAAPAPPAGGLPPGLPMF